MPLCDTYGPGGGRVAAVGVFVLTCANHGDGGLDVYPLVSVDARVDKDQPVKVGLLHAAQSVLDGVVVLRGYREHTIKDIISQFPPNILNQQFLEKWYRLCPMAWRLTSMFSLPLYLPGLL